MCKEAQFLSHHTSPSSISNSKVLNLGGVQNKPRFLLVLWSTLFVGKLKINFDFFDPYVLILHQYMVQTWSKQLSSSCH